MHRRLLIPVVLLAAAAVVFVLAVGLSAVKPEPDGAPAPTKPGGPSQISEAGGVQVKATFDPVADIAGDRINILISVDTHSVDLGQLDLAKLSRVTLEPGGPTIDLSWQPEGEGDGHHVGGRLTARAGTGALAGARSVRLEIAGVASEEPRRFEWGLGSR